MARWDPLVSEANKAPLESRAGQVRLDQVDLLARLGPRGRLVDKESLAQQAPPVSGASQVRQVHLDQLERGENQVRQGRPVPQELLALKGREENKGPLVRLAPQDRPVRKGNQDRRDLLVLPGSLVRRAQQELRRSRIIRRVLAYARSERQNISAS